MASPAIPRGSLVLVTGVNGLVSSHVADQLLQAGYRVRGTARSEDKAALMKEVFHPKYGKDSFETVVVGDMAAENAFAGAVKGTCWTNSLRLFSLSLKGSSLD